MTTINPISAHGGSNGNSPVATLPGGNLLNHPSPLLNPQASTSPWISDPKHISKKSSSEARPKSYKSPARTTATRSANSFSALANQKDDDNDTGDNPMYDTDANIITSTIITPAMATPPSPTSPSKKKLKKVKKAQKKIHSVIETAAAEHPNIPGANASKLQEDKDLVGALAITKAIQIQQLNARISDNKIKKTTKMQQKKARKLAQETLEAKETHDKRAAARNTAKEDANSVELDEVTSVDESEATAITTNISTNKEADIIAPNPIIKPVIPPVVTSEEPAIDPEEASENDSKVAAEEYSSEDESTDMPATHSHSVAMSWSFRCKNIPKAVCDISDTKIHSIAKWFGYALDQIKQQSKEVEILVINHIYRLSSKTNSFQTKLASLPDDKMELFMENDLPIISIQAVVSFNIHIHLTSENNHDLLDLIKKHFPENMGIEVQILSLDDIDAPSIYNSISNQSLNDRQLQDICGAPTHRTSFSRYSLRIDAWFLPTKVKREKLGKNEEDLDAFIHACVGMALDIVNDKMNGTLLLSRRKRESKAPPITNTNGSFQKQLRTMPYILFTKYFNRFCVRKENQYIWCDVILAHNESNKDCQQIWSDFLSSDWKLRLFPKKLQDAEQSASVYWIL
eukprot:scaffold23498_cov62-Attheya_sp.AAC.3